MLCLGMGRSPHSRNLADARFWRMFDEPMASNSWNYDWRGNCLKKGEVWKYLRRSFCRGLRTTTDAIFNSVARTFSLVKSMWRIPLPFWMCSTQAPRLCVPRGRDQPLLKIGPHCPSEAWGSRNDDTCGGAMRACRQMLRTKSLNNVIVNPATAIS